MKEPPLHVQVAQALGWIDCRLPKSGILDRDWIGWHLGMEIGKRDPIPRYDTDWSATGPLIEKFNIALNCRPDVKPSQRWEAYFLKDAQTRNSWSAQGFTPLLAVCHLIRSLQKNNVTDTSYTLPVPIP